MAKGQGVLALALAQIKKSDDQKAKDRVVKEVRKNHNDWRNELFAMETAAEEAADTYEALLSNTNVTARQLLDAKRNMDLTVKNLEDANVLAKARFDEGK